MMQEFENVQRTLTNSLRYMQEQSEKVLEDYNAICDLDSSDKLFDTLVFAIANRLDNFMYAFCDVMAFVEIHEKEPDLVENLSYHIEQCEAREIVQSQTGSRALHFLKKREHAVEDYFNTGRLNYEMLTVLASCGSGFAESTENLKAYCRNHFSAEELQEEVARPKKNAIEKRTWFRGKWAEKLKRTR